MTRRVARDSGGVKAGVKQAGSFYVCASARGWSVYALGADVSSSTTPIAEDLDVQGVLEQLNTHASSKETSGGTSGVVGVGAAWCLCAGVETDGLPRKPVSQFEDALAFRLERELPITAEQCAIGFIGDGEKRLGLAVQADRLQQLVHGLEDAGHVVEAIVPRALLAAQGWQDTQAFDTNQGPVALLWADPPPPEPPEVALEGSNTAPQYQLLVLPPSQEDPRNIPPDALPRWRSLGDDPQTLAQALSLDGLADTPCTWFADDHCMQPLQQALGLSTGDIQRLTPPKQAEHTAAHNLINKHHSPWVNLAQGPLAPRHRWRRVSTPAWSAIAAALFLLIASISVLLFRGYQHQQVAEQYTQQAREAFASALPNQPIPTSLKRRLRTQLNQLPPPGSAPAPGISSEAFGAHSGGTSGGGGTPLLVVFHDALAALPQDQRFVITDLRLEDDEIRLVGQARSHSEADQLADALRQHGRFIVQPPSTDNLSGDQRGVRFTLKATYTKPDSNTPPSDQPNAESPSTLAEGEGQPR